MTFVVHAVYAARCPDIHERSNVQRGSDRMPQPRLKIMLVEDDTIIGRYLSEVLEEGGYDVIQCLSNGSDALRAAVPLKPDLVLMDISLPGDIDGVEVARQFKTLHDLPVVFITAHSDRKTIERARDADCYGYVLKPIIDAQVFAAIEMAVQRSNLEGKVRASEEELRLLSAHLQTALEKERLRLAREIHDVLGQMLTALRIDLSWMIRRMPREEGEINRKAGSALRMTDDIIQNVRRICSELRPGVLDDLGLAAAIEWQARDLEKRSGIPFETIVPESDTAIEDERAVALFRIFQEAATNVLRHAGASRVKIELSVANGEARLVVSDNGSGISPAAAGDPSSFGLMGIRERSRHCGGNCTITGNPGRGTTVDVRIPLGG